MRRQRTALAALDLNVVRSECIPRPRRCGSTSAHPSPHKHAYPPAPTPAQFGRPMKYRDCFKARAPDPSPAKRGAKSPSAKVVQSAARSPSGISLKTAPAHPERYGSPGKPSSAAATFQSEITDADSYTASQLAHGPRHTYSLAGPSGADASVLVQSSPSPAWSHAGTESGAESDEAARGQAPAELSSAARVLYWPASGRPGGAGVTSADVSERRPKAHSIAGPVDLAAASQGPLPSPPTDEP
jgi:hypothetical protein